MHLHFTDAVPHPFLPEVAALVLILPTGKNCCTERVDIRGQIFVAAVLGFAKEWEIVKAIDE